MKMWKCTNCVHPRSGTPGVDFFGDDPVCPTCKLDGRETRFASRIIECRITHFDPPHSSVRNAGQGVLACDPTKRLGEVAAMATGVPDVVTCPLCRQTEAWKAVKAAADDGPDNIKITKGGLVSDVLG